MTTEPTFDELLDAEQKLRTAGSLPGPRTADMVTKALESENIDDVKAELVHSRAHYQALEYTLADTDGSTQIILDGIASGAYPTPSNTEEAIKLAVRVLSFGAIEAAYDAAHSLSFFIQALGMDLQTALETVFANLDHTDPERAVTDEALADLIDTETRED